MNLRIVTTNPVRLDDDLTEMKCPLGSTCLSDNLTKKTQNMYILVLIYLELNVVLNLKLFFYNFSETNVFQKVYHRSPAGDRIEY